MAEDLKAFETTSLHLAAALLVEIPGSLLSQIAPTPSVDGKRLITLQYPTPREADVQDLISRFLRHQLVVNLYEYNRALNRLRDSLHRQPEKEPCPSARSS